jgi:ABC-type sugar transport system permease subunit
MNKPILMATVALVTLMGATFALPTFQLVNAQYTGGGGPAGSIEQQLKLAREKVSNAQQAGAYGSGTSIFGSGINLNSTFGFIIIIAVIFGGVAGMFFIRARTPRKEAS